MRISVIIPLVWLNEPIINGEKNILLNFKNMMKQFSVMLNLMQIGGKEERIRKHGRGKKERG
jgi:hypothetical protein